MQSATEDRVADSAFKMIGRIRQEGAVLEQMGLLQRHGALGLHRTSLLGSSAACVSTAAQMEWAMACGPAEFWRFEWPWTGGSGSCGKASMTWVAGCGHQRSMR
jgi:hypothetical protein